VTEQEIAFKKRLNMKRLLNARGTTANRTNKGMRRRRDFAILPGVPALFRSDARRRTLTVDDYNNARHWTYPVGDDYADD
jgi:hypothetical protein